LNETIIKIDSLRFHWSKKSSFRIYISGFTVKRGEKILLLGESGSGKTTLLSLIAGFLDPLSGEININGKSINSLTSSKKDKFRADNFGIIFQQFNLLPYANIIDNIILPLYFSKRRSTHIKNRRDVAMTLCRRLKLPDDIAESKASSLSVGQQQRVAVARALIGNPPLIIADEPTSSLDTETQEKFLDLMFEQIDQNKSTLLMVSHDKSLSRRFDRIINIKDILMREN
tara:strand:- start:326 stop:1012 length:687 start_codon:yes stop_codon:yes gene_type:complete